MFSRKHNIIFSLCYHFIIILHAKVQSFLYVKSNSVNDNYDLILKKTINIS